MSQIDDLKKLSPEERLRKLRELAKKDKEEMQKAKDLIKRTESEIEKQKEPQKEFPEPEPTTIDVNKLFEGSELEQSVEQESEWARQAAEEQQIEYRLDLAKQLTEGQSTNLYSITKGLYNKLEESGYLNEEEQNAFDAAMTATQQKLDAIDSGEYLPSNQASEALVMSYKMAKAMQDKYR